MAGVMYLGNQMVSPVIIQGEEKIYNVDVADWLGVVNAQGVLVKDTKDINLVFNGVEDIGDNVLREKFQNDTRVKSVSFPDLKQITGSYACYCAFYASGVTSFSMPNLEVVEGDSCCFFMLLGGTINDIVFPKLKRINGDNCFLALRRVIFSTPNPFPNLEYVNGKDSFNTNFVSYTGEIAYFPKLEYIGDSAFKQTFSSNSYIKTVDFPVLREIGGYAFEYNSSCQNLETINMPSLTTVNNGFSESFSNCPKLKNINLPNVTSAGDYGFWMAFAECPNLEEIRFTSLTSVGGETFYTTFASYGNGNDKPLHIYFPSLNAQSFNGYTTCFNNMVQNRPDVTVHFPVDLEEVIGNWSDVLAGFGGTNTTILYDIDPCYVAINVVGTSSYHIYVFGREKTSPFVTSASDKEYTVYDMTNYRVFFGMLTGLVVDETTTFTADVTQATNKVTLATGVSGLTVTVSYLGQTVPLTNDGNGNYFFYTNGTNQEFSYTIGETEDTREAAGTFALTGQEQTVSVTLTPKQWVTFERPNLTADGIMGGNAFAVTSSGCYSTAANRQAYCAVDGNTTTSYYW